MLKFFRYLTLSYINLSLLSPFLSIGRRHQRRNPYEAATRISSAEFYTALFATAFIFAFAKHSSIIHFKPWFTFGLLPWRPSTLPPQFWPRDSQAVKQAMGCLVEYCVERATCAQSQAPAVLVSLSVLPALDEMLIGPLSRIRPMWCGSVLSRRLRHQIFQLS